MECPNNSDNDEDKKKKNKKEKEKKMTFQKKKKGGGYVVTWDSDDSLDSVDGEPYGPPIDRNIGKWALVTRPTTQSPRRARSKATCKTKTSIRTIQGKAPEA